MLALWRNVLGAAAVIPGLPLFAESRKVYSSGFAELNKSSKPGPSQAEPTSLNPLTSAVKSSLTSRAELATGAATAKTRT